MADPGGFTVDPAILAERLTTSFGDFFNSIGNLAAGAADAATHIEDDSAQIQAIVDDWIEMRENITEEVQKLKNFEFNPAWKTRVINVPIAIEQLRDLLDEIFHQVKDKFESIFEGFRDTATAISALKTSGSVRGAGEPTGLGRVVNEAENISGYVNFAFRATREAFDAAKDVTELFLDITTRIEKLEDVFLQQKNPRKRVTGSVVERVGKLHS